MKILNLREDKAVLKVVQVVRGEMEFLIWVWLENGLLKPKSPSVRYWIPMYLTTSEISYPHRASFKFYSPQRPRWCLPHPFWQWLWILTVVVEDRTMALKGAHGPVPRTCGYITLHGKTDSTVMWLNHRSWYREVMLGVWSLSVIMEFS